MVIPALNEEQRLPDLLGDLIEDGKPRAGIAAVVVVDGGSRDGTMSVARKLGADVHTTAPGRGRQMAAGAGVVVGDVLLFLHADARLGAGAIEALGAAFRDQDLVASGMRQRVDARGFFYRLVEYAANGRVRRGVVYGDSGLAVRRKAYESVGGFRDMPLFEDLDLSRRLRRVGPVRLVKDALLIISPRRWQLDGRLRRTFHNWMLTLAWKMGVGAERLARSYPVHSEKP